MKNINNNYFHVIDTKEKAYWLGFLFADGCIEQHKQVSLSLHQHDEERLNAFCDAIEYDKSKKRRRNDNLIRVRFACKSLIEDLIKLGCIPKKSLIIQMPKLDNKSLYLAFILGYYDGDGTVNKTVIACGSKIFLEQIKAIFNINNKITFYCHDGKIQDRNIKSSCYTLFLGAKLFNEMMDNYQNSMLRKRRYFKTKEEIQQIVKDRFNGKQIKNTLNITKEVLSDIVWKKTITDIANEYGVSDTSILKRCKKWNIKKPSRGYWLKVK